MIRPVRHLRLLCCAFAACVAPPALAAEHAATLDWTGKVALTLSVSGVLDSIAARPGQRVGKGEILAAL